MRYAMIRDGRVESVIEWDGVTEWTPGDDYDVIDCPASVGPGWTHDDDGFHAPPAPPPPDPKALKNAAVTAKREEVFAAGFSPSTGPLAGHTLQVRNDADKINWLTSATSYSAAVSAGAGAVMGATFRTMANETVVVTYAQGLTVIVQQMAAWGQSIMARSWALKDEIDAAADQAELDAIDIEIGWPE